MNEASFEGIYAALRNPSGAASRAASRSAGGFSRAIEQILSNRTMRELAAQDEGLARQLTGEILGFVNTAAGRMRIAENPFEKEEKLFYEFEKTGKDDFEEAWEELSVFLRQTYDAAVLDPEFYYGEFHAEDIRFESVKEHFLESWRRLLFSKRTNWELEFIDEQRKFFCKILYEQIERLKELEEILEPLTGELGRLWDMSRGRWRKINLDALRKYARLFKKDSSLQALADMLGRASQAEKEYKEEIFAETLIRPAWKTDHAGKAGIAGIHESDDLSSILPSEIALFAGEETQAIFYKKFAEKKLQTFEYKSTLPDCEKQKTLKKRVKEKEEKKGPFIICVDTSGSMQGAPETVAKTLCFAILKMAVSTGRQCLVISFSDGIKTLNLTDTKNELDKIAGFFSMSFYGGTDPVPAMKEALAMLETRNYSKADIVMVSDFVMPPLDARTRRRVRAAKKRKTKFHSIVIGKSGNTNAMRDFDNTWVYDVNNPGSALSPEAAALQAAAYKTAPPGQQHLPPL
ncbi:MAG: VWA domain-containing protein [Spirochaetales bacterium]|jgi:uncharacterized protein with von Willebrand factor type A (vWA) domain|nr:VWA domain-containing protein [Spirochaetales bacterium]